MEGIIPEDLPAPMAGCGWQELCVIRAGKEDSDEWLSTLRDRLKNLQGVGSRVQPFRDLDVTIIFYSGEAYDLRLILEVIGDLEKQLVGDIVSRAEKPRLS